MTDAITIDMTRKKANIVLDASKIDLFETCPRRYQIRHLFNKGTEGKAEALDKGSLMHGGLEVYFQELAKGTHYNERISAATMKMRELSSDPRNSFLAAEDVEILISAMEQSCDYWRHEDENCLEVLATEQPFAYVLFEDEHVRIIITGKIDLVVNKHGIGREHSYTRVPYDHKTYSRESMVLRKTNQFINYAAALESNYLIVNRIGLQKSKSAEEKFKRPPLSYDPQYIQDWKDNLTKMILNEYLVCIAENHFPEKPTSCNKFNRLCEYFEICDSSGIEAKEFKLANNYVDVEEWDVTKVME